MVICYRHDKGLMQTLESVTDQTDGVMQDKNQLVLSTGFCSEHQKLEQHKTLNLPDCLARLTEPLLKEGDNWNVRMTLQQIIRLDLKSYGQKDTIKSIIFGGCQKTKSLFFKTKCQEANKPFGFFSYATKYQEKKKVYFKVLSNKGRKPAYIGWCVPLSFMLL